MSLPINQIGTGGGAVAAGDDTPLYQSYQYWIPVDGSKVEGRGYWGTTRAVFVQNFSATQGMTISLDNRYTIKVPAGNREVFNIDFEIFEAQYDAGNAGNPGAITLFSDPQDNQSAIHSLTILGNVNATVSGSVSITGGTVSVTGSSVVVSSIPSITIGAVSGGVNFNVQDAIVETNTTTLVGVLANTIVPMTLTNNTIVNVTIAKAITSFALVLLNPEGFLNVWYTASGSDIYLTRMHPFNTVANNTWFALEKIYIAPIPAGAVLHVQMAQSFGGSTAVLKY